MNNVADQDLVIHQRPSTSSQSHNDSPGLSSAPISVHPGRSSQANTSQVAHEARHNPQLPATEYFPAPEIGYPYIERTRFYNFLDKFHDFIVDKCGVCITEFGFTNVSKITHNIVRKIVFVRKSCASHVLIFALLKSIISISVV